MLYSTVRTDASSGVQTVAVVGFVAARVMDVQFEKRDFPGPDGKPAGAGQIVAILQPTVLNVSTAVTDHPLRSLGPRTICNPYIAKVRVVE
jgi:hypothetical protein